MHPKDQKSNGLQNKPTSNHRLDWMTVYEIIEIHFYPSLSPSNPFLRVVLFCSRDFLLPAGEGVSPRHNLL